MSNTYVKEVLRKVQERFSREELDVFCRIMDTMDREILEDYSVMAERS